LKKPYVLKKLFYIIIAIILCQTAQAQITITAADMPVSGDTLRYSFANPATVTIGPGDSGTSVIWNYSLTPTRQAVDTYKTALAVNPIYALTISFSAYGYKVADTLPGTPIPITQVYTFFQNKTTTPSKFQAIAFAANVGGLPTPSNYDTADVWYFFPLNYLRSDSSSYQLNVSLATVGGLKQKGYRKTRVDGWGTIQTPYYTTPQNCLRVRSEIHEIDTISFGTTKFGLPRNSVEYKWLISGEHYPALWVVASVLGGTETITQVRYRDSVRSFDTLVVPPVDTTPVDNAVATIGSNISVFKCYPNPTETGIVTMDLPESWHAFTVELFDITSKSVATYQNERKIDLSSLPHGQYLARVRSGNEVGYAQIVW
jgi:hypothetical protein